jgi:hypothetical protein
MPNNYRVVPFPGLRINLPALSADSVELSASHFYAPCGENITENDPCIMISGAMYRAKADDSSRRPANCFACETATVGNYAVFQTLGTRENFAGLTPSIYYLANGGGVTNTPPSYPSTIQILGKGRSSTLLLLNIGLDLGSLNPGSGLDGIILGEDLSMIFNNDLELVLHG